MAAAARRGRRTRGTAVATRRERRARGTAAAAASRCQTGDRRRRYRRIEAATDRSGPCLPGLHRAEGGALHRGHPRPRVPPQEVWPKWPCWKEWYNDCYVQLSTK